MGSPNQDQVTFWAKLAIGLLIVLVGLEVINRVDPRLGNLYVVAILLGVILKNKTGFNQFMAFISSLVNPYERSGSKTHA